MNSMQITVATQFSSLCKWQFLITLRFCFFNFHHTANCSNEFGYSYFGQFSWNLIAVLIIWKLNRSMEIGRVGHTPNEYSVWNHFRGNVSVSSSVTWAIEIKKLILPMKKLYVIMSITPRLVGVFIFVVVQLGFLLSHFVSSVVSQSIWPMILSMAMQISVVNVNQLNDGMCTRVSL